MATVRKRNGKYQVLVRLAGFDPVSATFHTEKQAKAWGARKEAELKAGVNNPSPKDVRQLANVRFRDLLLKFNEGMKLTNTYSAALSATLADDIANLRLSEITKETAIAWRNRMQARLKPQSVAKYARVPAGAWDYGIEVLELPLNQNPFRKLKLKDVKAKRWRRLEGDEYKRLINACFQKHKTTMKQKGALGQDWADLIDFAIATAMRRGEILKARVGHVRGTETNQRSLWIPETKTEKPRLIPLSETATRIIDQRIARGFTDRLFPYHKTTVSNGFAVIRGLAGINNLHFHDLRHEALSRLNEIGLSQHDIMLVSGHKSTEHLTVYINPDIRRVSQKIWDSRQHLSGGPAA
jgi:integrase